MKKNLLKNSILAVAVLVLTAIGANAQTCPPLAAGCLDYSFGNGGVSLTNLATPNNNLSPTEGAMQSDGKFVALFDAHLNAGNSFTNVIVRYNADGSLDTSFGIGGVVYLNWYGANNSYANAYGIAIQKIGGEERIVINGTGLNGSSTSRLERFLPDGSLDPSFGSGGTALLNVGYGDDMTVQPDGKILTMGWNGTLVRLNINGSLDTSFGAGGVVQTSVVQTNALAVQSSGKILAAGRSTLKGKWVLTVARFNINGSLDDGGRNDSTSGDLFGTKGVTTINFYSNGESGANANADSIKIDASGKIVVAGGAWGKNTPGDFGVARLTANGQLDTTFGIGGKATIDFNGLADTLRSVELQTDGKIVLTGMSGTNAGLARLNANGTLDTSFGTNGKTVSDFSSAAERGFDGMIQFDPSCLCEKIVIVGTAEIGGIDYALAARYLP